MERHRSSCCCSGPEDLVRALRPQTAVWHSCLFQTCTENRLQEEHNANLSAVDFRVDRHGGVGVFAAEDLDGEGVAMSVTNQTSIGMEDFLVGPKFRLTRIASGLHDPEEGHSLSMRLFLTM